MTTNFRCCEYCRVAAAHLSCITEIWGTEKSKWTCQSCTDKFGGTIDEVATIVTCALTGMSLSEFNAITNINNTNNNDSNSNNNNNNNNNDGNKNNNGIIGTLIERAQSNLKKKTVADIIQQTKVLYNSYKTFPTMINGDTQFALAACILFLAQIKPLALYCYELLKNNKAEIHLLALELNDYYNSTPDATGKNTMSITNKMKQNEEKQMNLELQTCFCDILIQVMENKQIINLHYLFQYLQNIITRDKFYAMFGRIDELSNFLLTMSARLQNQVKNNLFFKSKSCIECRQCDFLEQKENHLKDIENAWIEIDAKYSSISEFFHSLGCWEKNDECKCGGVYQQIDKYYFEGNYLLLKIEERKHDLEINEHLYLKVHDNSEFELLGFINEFNSNFRVITKNDGKWFACDKYGVEEIDHINSHLKNKNVIHVIYGKFQSKSHKQHSLESYEQNTNKNKFTVIGNKRKYFDEHFLDDETDEKNEINPKKRMKFDKKQVKKNKIGNNVENYDADVEVCDEIMSETGLMEEIASSETNDEIEDIDIEMQKDDNTEQAQSPVTQKTTDANAKVDICS